MLLPSADDNVDQALKASCVAITNPDSSANPLKSPPFHIGTELIHKNEKKSFFGTLCQALSSVL